MRPNPSPQFSQLGTCSVGLVPAGPLPYVGLVQRHRLRCGTCQTRCVDLRCLLCRELPLSHGSALDAEGVQELLKQQAREAVRGHEFSTRILEGAFAQQCRSVDSPMEDILEEWTLDI